MLTWCGSFPTDLKVLVFLLGHRGHQGFSLTRTRDFGVQVVSRRFGHQTAIIAVSLETVGVSVSSWCPVSVQSVSIKVGHQVKNVGHQQIMSRVYRL